MPSPLARAAKRRNNIESLRQHIRVRYGCDSIHVGTEMVTEWSLRAVADRTVELFQLMGQRAGMRAYAWLGNARGDEQPRVVLAEPPVQTASDAVAAA